jgi:hypothetical protein
MSSHDSARAWSPPVLVLFLVMAGLVCLAAAFCFARFDVASLVELRLTGAQGAVSPETSAWLRGPTLHRGLAWTGIALVGLAILAGRWRPVLGQLVTAPTGPPVLRPWTVPLLAVLAVLVQYYPTLTAGYFRYDDFEFVGVARDGAFWSALWQPHGDHVLPLTRVLFWLAYHLFGVTAWPYSAAVLLCLAGCLVAGVLLLMELKTGVFAQLLFIALVVFWSPAAEIMSGYYILSTYLLIALLGLVAALAWLRWLRLRWTGDALLLLACAGLAPLVDLSGLYVPGICGLFCAASATRSFPNEGFRPWLAQHLSLMAGLVLVTAATLAVTWYAYVAMNPGIFLAMSGGGRTFARTVAEYIYLVDAGLLLSMVTPFVYARLPAVLLGVLLAAVTAGGIAGFFLAWRRAEAARRRDLFTLLLIVGGICLMVTLGRHNADALAVRWAAKHVMPAYLWLCLLLCAGWDAWWAKLRSVSRLPAAELTLVAVGLFAGAQTLFGLLGMAVAFPPFGYPAEIRDALRRHAAVTTLGNELAAPLARSLGNHAIVPTLDGNYLQQRWPSLFRYNFSHYTCFFPGPAGGLQLVRNPAMQPWHTSAVQTVPVLRDAISPGFLQELHGNSVVRALYLAEVPLEPAPAITTTTAARPPGGIEATVPPGGRAEVALRLPAWDPEKAYRLQIAVRLADAAGSSGLSMTVVFRSECLPGDWHGSLLLLPTDSGFMEVDLRQVYAFALSPQVSDLRVIVTKPGHYWFRLAEAAR